MTSTLRVSSANTARTKPTTGDTKTTFVIDDHLGWLKCDGRILDKVQYNLLFQVIGYTFGGSGASFKLPDLQGRVLGSVGTVTDANSRTRSYAPGDKVGELDHKLTVSEMPAHNHNSATGTPGSNTTANGTTSSSITGVTDSGHSHSYANHPNTANPAVSLTTTSVAADTQVTQTTGTGNANIVDPGHTHTIASNGGDQYHNNIQPTLFYGNLFIYSGIPMIGKFPYMIGLHPVLI